MKKLILAATASMLITGTAMAADAPMAVDLPVVPAPVSDDWAGYYVGLYAGGAWGEIEVDDVNGYNGATAGDFDYDDSGFYGGILGGHNWQRNRFVFGVEGELGYLGLDESAQLPAFVGVRLATDSRSSIDTDFYASLTGRAGIAAGRVLIYAKGGVAGLDTDVSFIDTDPTGTTLASGTRADKFMVGWTAGGGLEVMLRNGWSARGEYMYNDLGDINVRATSAGGTVFNFNHDVEVHTGKLVIGKRY